MVEKIENKIEEFEKEKRETYYRNKQEDLEFWGLTTQRNAHGIIPLTVTDEEYERLKKASKGTHFASHSHSSLANCLTIIAIVLAVAGVVFGVILYSAVEELKFVILSACIFGSALLSLIFYVLAEIIKTLNKMSEDKNN